MAPGIWALLIRTPGLQRALGVRNRQIYWALEYHTCLLLPHIFVWGSYFWGCPAPHPPPSSSPPPLLLLCHPHGNPRHTRHTHCQHHALILMSLTHTTQYAHFIVTHCHSLTPHTLTPHTIQKITLNATKRTLRAAPSEAARALGANPPEDSKRP